MIKKSPEAYRTIGEASNEIGVPTYVLRFWETKFKQVKLIKRPGGRRFYKPEDIKLLLKIKNFLKNDGLSIKQVNEKLNSEIDHVKSNNNEYIIPSSEEKTTLKNKDEVLKRLNKILGEVDGANAKIVGRNVKTQYGNESQYTFQGGKDYRETIFRLDEAIPTNSRHNEISTYVLVF